MATVHRGEATITVTDEERDILTNACKIVARLKHDWFMEDDNCYDDERYWMLVNMVESFDQVFGISNMEV